MTDVQQTLKVIFMEAAKVFGKDQSKKMIEELPETTVKAEKEEKQKDEKATKRIQRMTPTLANKLKAELVKVGITFSSDEKAEKKELDKSKKEFTSYVEDLTNDDFTAKPLEKHMEDFANSKKPATTATTAAVESTSTTPKKSAKTEKAKKTEAPKKKESTTIPSSGPSNAATIHDVSLEELQALEMVATPSDDQTGVLWDADNGRWVRGPPQDDDEDLTEKTFQGKTYAIGDITGRVYETTDDRDIFRGYVGVGTFSELKV